MPTVSTFGNGQVFTSSALTEDALNQILQALTVSVLGIDPATDPKAYYKVRVAWQGQPGWPVTDDICAIRLSETDDPFTRVRDRKYAPNDSATLMLTDTFTRAWEASYSFYGPNGGDNARLLKSASTLDWFLNTLKASLLAVVPIRRAVVRNPELYQGNWWNRHDYRFTLYEFITETLTVPSIASAEVILYSNLSLTAVADVVASAS
jgi:hypothetical protein